MNNHAAAAADVLGAKVTLLFCRNLVLFLRISSGGAVPDASDTRVTSAQRPGRGGRGAKRGPAGSTLSGDATALLLVLGTSVSPDARSMGMMILDSRISAGCSKRGRVRGGALTPWCPRAGPTMALWHFGRFWVSWRRCSSDAGAVPWASGACCPPGPSLGAPAAPCRGGIPRPLLKAGAGRAGASVPARSGCAVLDASNTLPSLPLVPSVSIPPYPGPQAGTEGAGAEMHQGSTGRA